MAGTEISSGFNRPQLDGFYARWNVYNPHLPQVQQNLLAETLTTPPCEDALRPFPISTTVAKELAGRTLSR